MKAAAIIGAGSMLGRELSSQLRERGISIVSVGRADNNDIVTDLTVPLDPAGISGWRADVLFHCASSFAGDDIAGARVNFMTNSIGALSVLTLVDALESEYCIYAGTVFSMNGVDSAGYSSYGLSKAHAEDILEWGMDKRSGGFCSMRLSQLYDTDGLCCMHQPWLGRIVAYASRGMDLKLPPGSATRNYLHIHDAARLMILSAERRLSGRHILCHPDNLDNATIAHMAYTEFKKGGRVIIDDSKTPFREFSFPVDARIFDQLGDFPHISMAEGLSMINGKGAAVNFGPMDVK